MVPNVKIKVRRLHSEVELPKYETTGSVGMDLRSQCSFYLEPGDRVAVPTGLAFEIPEGFEAQIRPRSGLAVKKGVTVINAPGTIDQDYRGEVCVPIVNHGDETVRIDIGDRIAQIVFAPVARAELEEVEELTDTKRGTGGFGSTGV